MIWWLPESYTASSRSEGTKPSKEFISTKKKALNSLRLQYNKKEEMPLYYTPPMTSTAPVISTTPPVKTVSIQRNFWDFASDHPIALFFFVLALGWALSWLVSTLRRDPKAPYVSIRIDELTTNPDLASKMARSGVIGTDIELPVTSLSTRSLEKEIGVTRGSLGGYRGSTSGGSIGSIGSGGSPVWL